LLLLLPNNPQGCFLSWHAEQLLGTFTNEQPSASAHTCLCHQASATALTLHSLPPPPVCRTISQKDPQPPRSWVSPHPCAVVSMVVQPTRSASLTATTGSLQATVICRSVHLELDSKVQRVFLDSFSIWLNLTTQSPCCWVQALRELDAVGLSFLSSQLLVGSPKSMTPQSESGGSWCERGIAALAANKASAAAASGGVSKQQQQQQATGISCCRSQQASRASRNQPSSVQHV
jgi:hypothetical protein